MGFEHIRLEHSPAAVATVTLARPQSLNALSGAMVDELRAAVGDVAGSSARCLLIDPPRRGPSASCNTVREEEGRAETSRRGGERLAAESGGGGGGPRRLVAEHR